MGKPRKVTALPWKKNKALAAFRAQVTKLKNEKCSECGWDKDGRGNPGQHGRGCSRARVTKEGGK